MKDILGKAIYEYYNGDRKSKLWVYDHLGPRVEMKRETYFRSWDEMPKLEKIALESCSGSILDVGAGAGSHSLVLQSRDRDVTAMDISAFNCKVMKGRGVHQVVEADFFSYNIQSFDTILLLMNGVGICGKLTGFSLLLQQCGQLLEPGGKVILDSSDLSYIYDEDLKKPTDRYYGEVDCAYSYKDAFSETFTWLYLDFGTMCTICKQKGWSCTLLYEDGNNQFLVALEKE